MRKILGLSLALALGLTALTAVPVSAAPAVVNDFQVILVAGQLDRDGHPMGGGLAQCHQVINDGDHDRMVCQGTNNGHIPEKGVTAVGPASPKLMLKGNRVESIFAICGAGYAGNFTEHYDTEGNITLICDR